MNKYNNKTIEILERNNLLRVIHEPLDIYLEIPHVAYIETKKEKSKALLFTNVVDKKKNKKFDTPVLMNVFCNEKAIELFIGNLKEIENEISSLLKMEPAEGFSNKIKMFGKLFNLKYAFPKKLKKRGVCQEVIHLGQEAKTSNIPVLTTWEQDAGAFITMGQVYTKSLNGKMSNVGMYRLQIHNDHQVGLHWQIHKDSNHFFHEYKQAGKKMPVSIAIGGHPLYIWSAQSPLPIGIFELLLYGFLKKENAKLVQCISNELYVPHDVDFVIEGFVDTSKTKIEGPFGDHTGYYTLEDEYPFLEVTAITHKKTPVFLATVVGKPPLEDKYMGHATERIFKPLLQTTVPDLVDYYLPENGVFHNLVLAKIKVLYPGHAQQVMHALWGIGQMSFVKHAIFVSENAPALDSMEIIPYILNRLDIHEMLLSRGIVDALDHSSPKFAVGGKLGIDVTQNEIQPHTKTILENDILLEKIKACCNEVDSLEQYYTDTSNPIVVLAVKKNRSHKTLLTELQSLFEFLKVVVVVDIKNNQLENPYMLLWRVVNNIDANRDLYFAEETLLIDASNKNHYDNYQRIWPDDVSCTPEVINRLKKKNVIDIDNAFEKKFSIFSE